MNKNKEIEKIAKLYLKLETLETRNQDPLDFREQAVWNIKAALEDAYNSGRIAGLRAAAAITYKG